MCLGSSPAKPNDPAPAPPPAPEGPTAPMLDEKNASSQGTIAANRAGRGSLRIDRTTSVPSVGSGLNIPT